MSRAARALVGALLAALCCTHAAAQSTAPNCPPVAAEPSPEQLQAGLREARDRGFLWRISKDGRSSWLFGTVHVAKLAWAFPGPALRDAMAQSDTLALEIDLLDPSMQQRMAAALREMAKTPLPPALQARLTQRAQLECVPPEALAALAPEMQVAALTTLAGRSDGLDPAYGIDAALAGWAQAAKKETVSLETPELQLKALQWPTPAQAIEFVAGNLDELESGRTRATLIRLTALWAEGDLAQLQRYEAWCDCIKTEADRAAMTRMVDARNPALADSIAQLHAGGQRVFAAVGSLHMIGPTGLPALMAQRGYRVERIAYPPIDHDKTQETRP